jgi:hypothetical protein
MKYEKTPVKHGADLAKKEVLADIEKLGTLAILWHLVKRHKFALVTTYATALTLYFLFPFLPDVLFNLF